MTQLYYNTDVKATTAVLATFSTACFGWVPNVNSVDHLTRCLSGMDCADCFGLLLFTLVKWFIGVLVYLVLCRCSVYSAWVS
jgi:hypothetical protein